MKCLAQILVVEDIDGDFATVGKAARQTDIAHQLPRAVSGNDCMRFLQELLSDPSSIPARVMMNLDSQSDDGRDTLIQIKTNLRLRLIPVVILTTSLNSRDVQFCCLNYGNAYHFQPVSHTSHLQTLEQIFNYWLGSALLPTERPAAQ